MTKARRLLAVAALLGVTALVSSSSSWGDSADRKDRIKLRPDGDGVADASLAPAAAPSEEALATAKLTKGDPVLYRTMGGDSLFAVQLKPALEAVKAQPRDYLIMIGISASQAGGPWFAARQLAEELVKHAGEQDRVSIWTINDPENTKNLTQGFAFPRSQPGRFEPVLEKFKKDEWPAGTTDLGRGLERAINSFEITEGRRRILLYLGDGLSTHNPVSNSARTQLCKQMVDRKITFFPVPLGMAFNPDNLHGLASGTGGTVVRVQVLEETREDAMKKLQEAFAAPILYPTRFEMEGVAEFLPSRLPPLRPDVPTLVVGRIPSGGHKSPEQALKNLSYVIQGVAQDGREDVVIRKTETLPEPELDNFFLVSILNQWQNAREQPALVRADRALVFAYEQNRLQREDLLLGAQLAMQNNELDAAAALYERVQKLSPTDPDAAAGMKVLANLREGKITRESLRKRLDEMQRDLLRVEKGGKVTRLKRDEIIRLAQLGEKANLPKGGVDLPPQEREDLLQQHRDRQIIEEQKTTEMVDFALRKARRTLEANPDEARELLRGTLLRVSDDPDIGERVRTDLVNRLQIELRNVEIQGAAIKLRREDQARMREAVAREITREKQQEAEMASLEGQYRVYKNLINRARFEETTEREVLAGLTAMRQEAIIKGTPVPVAVTSAYFQTAVGYNLQQMIELRRRREQGFMATMMSVERSAVPFPDEPPISFPPLATWRAITEERTKRNIYTSADLPNDREGRQEAQRIWKLLDIPMDTKTFDAPAGMSLKDFIGLIYDKFSQQNIEVPILVDFEAFKDANPDVYKEPGDLYDIKVAIPQIPKKLALGTILRIALGKIPTNNATFLIRRNYIEITTSDAQQKEKITRVYPVGDLVLPISPAGPNSLNQLGGALGAGQAFSGGGLQGIGGGFGGGLAGIGGGLGGFGGGLGGFGGGLGGLGALGGGLGALGGGLGALGGGLGALGVGGLGALGAGGLGALGVGGVGFPGGGLAGIGGFQIGGGLAGGIPGIGGGVAGVAGGVILGGAMGQNCLGFNLGGFNGNLGFQGSTQNQLLIALIQQTIAPGEWGAQNCQNPLLAAAAGMAGGPAPINQPENLSQTNTLGFYPPALALVVRGTSRIHVKQIGGYLGGKQKAGEAAGVGRDADRGPDRLAAGNPQKKLGVLGDHDEQPEDPAKKKRTEAIAKAMRTGEPCPICGKIHDEWDPRKVWQAALEYGVGDPGIILATADFLADHGKFDHVAEFLKADLRMGICVRPWVYQALAVALEASGGSQEDIRRARLSAVALNPKDALGFLRGARALADARQWERCLGFCRQAAQLEPNLSDVYDDALHYAELAKDSRAMEWAVGNLLSKDWPVDNEVLHLKAQAKLEALAQVLDGEGRKDEAERMRNTLRRQRERDVVVQLTWQDGTGPADLEMSIAEPGGTVCSSQQRQTPGGGILLGNTLSQRNRATYVAAEGFTGNYDITIRPLWGRPLGGRALLEVIQHQGTPRETRHVQAVAVDGKRTVKVALAAGRRTAVAVVPPPGLREKPTDEEKRVPGGIMATLRDIADPDVSDYQKTTGSAGSTAPSALALEPELRSRPRGEHLALQVGITPASGSGIDLTARAIVSDDQRRVTLSVTPVFQTVARASGPVVNLPIIPGGTEP
jgi:hypothetical protein